MIKAVLFDLDGTIADTLQDLAFGANYVLEQNGYETHKIEKYKIFVGNGIAKLIERILPEAERTDENLQRIKKQFIDYYGAHYCDRTNPYDDIVNVLVQLKAKGIKIAVVTNKAQAMADAVVNKLFGQDFCAVYGQREDFPTKPDPALTYIAMKDLGVAPDECLFVGDSNVDMQTANNSGAKAVGVLWGFREKEELEAAGAKAIISHPAQLLELL